MRATAMGGLNVALPSAPWGPLSSVGTQSTWRMRCVCLGGGRGNKPVILSFLTNPHRKERGRECGILPWWTVQFG